MILHPGILSLITGSAIVIVMLAYASLNAVKILRHWDMKSSSAGQLALERKTYLVSVIMNFVMGFLALSVFLFVYTVDDIHSLFIGAMCATGSLNANSVGWMALFFKLAAFFLSLLWMAINYIDQQAEDYPLVRIKYIFLLVMVPLVVMDSYYQIVYFTGLKPNIITSCCGALFGEYGGEGPANTIASAPVKPMMALFYSTIGLFLFISLMSRIFQKSFLKYVSAMLSLLVMVVAMASIISFVSLYIYEIPTHHCPFDIIQKDYYYIGFPIYVTLLGGVYFGMLSGVLEPLRGRASLGNVIDKYQTKWSLYSMVLILIFTLICTWPILYSDFTLEGFF